MSDLIITERSNIVAIADAVRNKKGITEGLTLGAITTEIENIQGDTQYEDAMVQRTLTTYTNDRVDSIGNIAFREFSSLTSVNFPACTSIGAYAFDNCSSLTSVSFPACTTIGNGVFRCSSLTSVNFPACTTIGRNAFSKCYSLINITLGASTVCKLNASNAFTSTAIASGTGYIYVPSSLVASYQTATNWIYFSSVIKAIEE